MQPPVARRDDVVEVVHGCTVADPYRWMEDLDDPALADWVDGQAAHADAVLAALPARDTLRATLARSADAPRSGAPWRRGGWWFHRRNTGLQDHDVLWCAPRTALPGAPTDGWRVLIDPNGWDGARSLAAVAASDDGGRIAYAVSEAGSDWQTWHVRQVAGGGDLPDTVPWSKFAGASWLPDGSGFLTCCFDRPPPGEEHEAALADQRVVLHRLGARTTTVHARPDAPQLGFDPVVTADGGHVVIGVSRGTDPETRVHVAPLHADGSLGEVTRLLDEADAAWHPIAVRDGELWCTTDLDAPAGRVVAVPLAGGVPREIVGEGPRRLQAAWLVGDRVAGQDGWLVTLHLDHATARVTVHDPGGAEVGVLPFDEHVSVDHHLADAVAGGRDDTVLHVVTSGFTSPSRLVAHDLPSGTTTTLGPELRPTDPVGTRAGAGASDDPLSVPVVAERVFVDSSGVDVPAFLVRRQDVRPDGTVPTVLWGYGGFDIAVGPTFRPGWRAWVAHGGLLVVACLRGGGEYGRAWHDDGRLGAKQHVFDDALAVARWLTGDGTAVHDPDDRRPVRTPAWTASDHLGIEGRSNGGLLVGACVTQAPTLFGSAVPEVGVLDMLRFHRFTIGWAWTSDYGDPDDPEAFAWVAAYSPLHRIEEGTVYPATLVTTGDTDDRVVPSHSFKFAAALQHAQAGHDPVVLRIDRAAGHGAGKPVGQLLDERADVLAWHAAHLGLVVDRGT